MSWTAPPLQHLLEARLRDARLELFSDPRLGVEKPDGLAPMFPARLVHEKLAAAAKAGLDAVEASLRLAASEALSSRGIGPEHSRAALRAAGEKLRARGGAGSVALPWMPSPYQVAGALVLVFALVDTVIALAAELPWWGIALLLLDIPAAIFIALAYNAERVRRHRRQLSELPARVCRQYIDDLKDSIGEYEDTVQSLIATPPAAES